LLLLLTARIRSLSSLSENHYYLGDAEYRSGNYQAALQHFRQAIQKQPDLPQHDPLLRFKMGFALFKTRRWDEAELEFRQAEEKLDIIADYAVYFRGMAYLARGDTLAALKQFRRIRQQYPQSALQGELDSVYAEIYLRKQPPDSARKYLRRMLKQRRFDRSLVYLKLLQTARLPGDSLFYRKYAFKFLRKYPMHHDAEGVYGKLLRLYSGKIPWKPFRAMMTYLFKSRQLLAAQKLLKRQRQFSVTPDRQEYLEWLAVEIDYRQGEYRRVLDWCLKNRSRIQTGQVLRNIDLHIARCYLRLGRTDKAIRSYLKFRERFPRDDLAPEVLWKVAWLYEGQGNMNQAIRTYRLLVQEYPRYEFAFEADFRVGLNYYRQKAYKKARQAWQSARKRTQNPYRQARLDYWIGKCYEKEGRPLQQQKIYLRLAQRPVDSYYNLKAFYRIADTAQVRQQFQQIIWELHHQQYSYLPHYLNSFNRAMLIRELLGNHRGSLELSAVQKKTDNWKYLYAVGELHERWRNYGEAYRKFRAIFNTFFAGANLPEMLPVFKRLYPFYYHEHVQPLSDSLKVPEALVYSVMKKESSFDHRALSYANAYGLMQLLPGTASQMAARLKVRFRDPAQLFRPELNIRMGTAFLSQLLRQFEGNPYLVLAAYNAGPHRAQRWKKKYGVADNDFFMENIEFEQTRRYVRNCMKYYWVYQAIMQPGKIPPEIIPLVGEASGQNSVSISGQE